MQLNSCREEISFAPDVYLLTNFEKIQRQAVASSSKPCLKINLWSYDSLPCTLALMTVNYLRFLLFFSCIFQCSGKNKCIHSLNSDLLRHFDEPGVC